jgi:hypothetical protein
VNHFYYFFLMVFLHNPTYISENCVVSHLKVLYDKNRIDPICENCVVWHILSNCVNKPLMPPCCLRLCGVARPLR